MDKFESKAVENKKVWETFVLSRSPKSFLQSWNWGETQQIVGNKVIRIGFYFKDRLVGICQIVKERARRGTYLVIPGGPLIDWQNKLLVDVFLQEVKRIGKAENAVFVRVRPEILDAPENKSLFINMGFVSAPMHLHAENTWILKIDKPDLDILSGMRKTTRYLVKKSLNSGLEVEVTKDENAAKIIYELQKETVERHKFVGFSENIFRAQILSFCKDNQAEVFVVRKNRKTLAAAIIIFYGDTAYYHHSASTSEFHEIPFSYFLQWSVIQEAKKRGCKYYNFWGIAPNDNPKHRFAGVTIFKTGFGGERIDWLHAQDLPLTLSYPLDYLFETFRRIVRKL